MKQAGNKTNKVEEMLLNLKVMIRITLMLDEITQSNIQVQGLRWRSWWVRKDEDKRPVPEEERQWWKQ